MLQLLKRMAILFQKEDRTSFFLLGLAILFNSFMEVLGIGLIVPFISLLAHPEMLETNAYLHQAYTVFHFSSFLQYMLVLVFLIIGVYVVKNTLLLLIAAMQARFLFNKQTHLCARLFKAYLLSPYSFHLRRNLGQFQEKLKTVEGLMQSGVLAILIVLTEGLLVMCLFVVLLKTNALLTLAAMSLLVGGIAFYFYFFKDKLHHWGQMNNHHMALLWQQVNEGLGSIKESKLLGKELYFVNSYRHHAQQMAIHQNKSELVIRSPRLFIETTVVAMVMGYMAICLLSGQAPSTVFTTISVFALVTMRLMPSLNRISSSWGGIKYFMPGFNAIYDDLVTCEKLERDYSKQVISQPLSFNKEIKMEEVVFYYENTTTPALNHVSFTIPKNSVVGLIGSSGAGKTTAIDLILGLLQPTSGKITVDGEDIHSHLRSWQTTIGYIPQIIYLCDDTIKNNIAFGVDSKDINETQVWESLRMAQLDEFVRSLPQGIETKVGDRGVRLSGGQRQRIGIARSLYHNPQVLVMDEATAALDNETERLFMNALFMLSKEKTIIIIAHRLTTVQRCDKIFFFKDGKIISEGQYNDLSNDCAEFRKMAGVGHF